MYCFRNNTINHFGERNKSITSNDCQYVSSLHVILIHTLVWCRAQLYIASRMQRHLRSNGSDVLLSQFLRLKLHSAAHALGMPNSAQRIRYEWYIIVSSERISLTSDLVDRISASIYIPVKQTNVTARTRAQRRCLNDEALMKNDRKKHF